MKFKITPVFSFITHRPLWLNIVTGLLLALIVFFIFVFSLNWMTHHNESKTVPAVTGKSLTEAETILEKAGFEMEIQDSVYVDSMQPMRVLRQVPEDGEIVKVNRTVYVTVNRAVPPMIEMPNLVGYSFRSAQMELSNLGLRVGDTTPRPDFARNTILEQRYQGQIIRPGTKVRMGTAIDFIIGTGVGTQKFVVPALIGLTYCQAKAMLESNGLVISASMAPGVTDTCHAYIYKQIPEKYGDEHKFNYLKTGQMIDVWLQTEKPVTDSLSTPPPVEEQK